MRKEYKPRIIKIFKEFIIAIVAIVVLFFIGTLFLKVIYLALISLAIFLWYLLVVIKDQMLKIEVDEKNLYISLKGKTEIFPIDKCSFNYKSVNNDDFSLTILYNDKVYNYDISLLSLKDVESLLTDLKIIGDNSQVIRIKAKGE